MDRICSWPFLRIIPAHLQTTIDATPRDFKAAFGFLTTTAGNPITSLAPASVLGMLRSLQSEARTVLLSSRGNSQDALRHRMPRSPRDGSLSLAGQVTPFGNEDTTLLRTINSFLLASGTISQEETPSRRVR